MMADFFDYVNFRARLTIGAGCSVMKAKKIVTKTPNHQIPL
jgi:hypothetical protein